MFMHVVRPSSVTSLCLLLMCTEALTTAWTKFYCQYEKENRALKMIAYNQTVGKGISGVSSFISFHN